MLVCARCGASNQTPGKFCATCGAPTAAPPGPPGWAPPPAQSPYGPPPGAPPAQNPGYGAPVPGPGPGYGAPAPSPGPGYGPPAQSPGPGYGAPGPAPGYGPPGSPPAPQAQPGWGPPPGHGSTPGAYGPPGWNTPAPQYPGVGGGYDAVHRVGTPDGLNPFGATMSPDQAGVGVPPPAAMPPPYAPAPVPQAQPPAWPHQPSSPPPEQRLPDPVPPGPGDTRVSMAPESTPAARDPEHLSPDAPRTLAGFLVNYGDSDVDLGRFWPIHQGRTLIGRKDAAPGLDIEIDHATTSSRHAVIYASARPARLKIEDPGSTNGTFVNEERLNFGSKHELSDGDTIRFGGFTVIVKIV